MITSRCVTLVSRPFVLVYTFVLGASKQRRSHPKWGPKTGLWQTKIAKCQTLFVLPSEQTRTPSHALPRWHTAHGGAVDSAHSHAPTRPKKQSQPTKIPHVIAPFGLSGIDRCEYLVGGGHVLFSSLIQSSPSCRFILPGRWKQSR